MNADTRTSRAFASRSPHAAAAQPPASACGVRPARPAPGRCGAFTLIEIVACMAIFAIGFAAIAMMLPAGTVMQHDVEARALGDIVGRNSLEVMKGKGIQPLAYCQSGVYIGTFGLSDKVMDGGTANDDVDSALYLAWAGFGTWNCTPGSAAHTSLLPFYDTNASGYFMHETGNGGAYSDAGDCTNLVMGRIHAQKERPLVVGGRGLPLDCSYPSSVLDIAARSYYATILLTNQSRTPNADVTWRYLTSQPSTFSWLLTAVTLRREGNAEWPEQVEADTTAGAPQAWWWTGNTGWSANWLCSNTIVDCRSAVGDPALAGRADPGPNYLWPRYNPAGSPSSQGTVPATGGNPGDTSNNGWQQTGQYDSWLVAYNSPGWDLRVNLPLNTPVREATASRYGYYPTGGNYRYPVPNLMTVNAIVYDRDGDLLLLRWPQGFARKLVNTGKGELNNARARSYRAKLGIDSALGANDGVGWVDRRLKVGDRFLSSNGGYAFSVKELLDPVAAAAAVSVPPYSGTVDWSDGTYQIVRVTPSLRTTSFTANKPIGTYSVSRWNDPSPMCSIFVPGMIVAPAPAGSGVSPWTSTVQLIDGGTPFRSGAVFRQWNNLTD